MNTKDSRIASTIKIEDITKEKIIDFINHHQPEFQSTHQRLSIPIINRLYKKMIHGIKFTEIKVYDNLVIDGHHRYISSLLANKNINTIPTLKPSKTKTITWKTIEFVDEEWDTPEKIKILNMEDAEFNNISISVLLELTK